MSFFMIVFAGFLLLLALVLNSLMDLLNKRVITYHPPQTMYMCINY